LRWPGGEAEGVVLKRPLGQSYKGQREIDWARCEPVHCATPAPVIAKLLL